MSNVYENRESYTEAIMAHWPRYEEDGTPILPGMQAYGFHGPVTVGSVELYEDGGWRLYGFGEPHPDDELGGNVVDRFIINEGNKGEFAHKTLEYAEAYQTEL